MPNVASKATNVIKLICLLLGGFQGGFQGFQSSIDPEELFRKIFGQGGFRMSGFGQEQDFEESQFGFAPASEVQYITAKIKFVINLLRPIRKIC